MTHQKLDKSSSAGFTLVEVMTAAVVLIMVFLSSLSAIQQCFTISAMQRDITLAGQIAQSKVEDLRLKPWSSLSVASGPFDVATFGLESDAVKLARFTGTCSVVGDTGRTDSFARVTVTVRWSDTTGSTKSRSYETLIGKSGLSDYFVTTHSTP